jgi:starch-binding outer membrane protein, SusD/RagB family
MRTIIKKPATYLLIIYVICALPACEEFLTPELDSLITEERLYEDFFEYRSIALGMYGLQQDLVEQLIVLGELRGDLLTVTENAERDLIEINEFNVSKNNKYADPTNFFKLIAATNRFINILKVRHPDVLDPKSPVTNFDRLYGEALCMRAWTYFMVARIYGRVPFIHESLTTIEEIRNYVNSPGTYTDSIFIVFSRDGYYNDTIFNNTVELEKKFFDLDMVLDYFTRQLENEIKAVGVNHARYNNDPSWEIVIWNDYAKHTLLGMMYLTRGNLSRAEMNFRKVMVNNSTEFRYQITNTFSGVNWKNIFTNISNLEHIYIIRFNKADQRQHDLQRMFEPFAANQYQLKPTQKALDFWETSWRGQQLNRNDLNPSLTRVTDPGIPGDWFRGAGVSYNYFKGTQILRADEVAEMLQYRANGDPRNVQNIMDGYRPYVNKYSINKNPYDQDADFILFRAAAVHLYMAEIFTHYYFPDASNVVRPNTIQAVNILNDGTNYSTASARPQRGVRGRVGIGGGHDRVEIRNIEYHHDPYTNKIIGYEDLAVDFQRKQFLFEQKLMNERARELAYEGERFYDLMRVAGRRNDPSFLAKAISEKFPPGKKEKIYQHLLNPQNWYIDYFD